MHAILKTEASIEGVSIHFHVWVLDDPDGFVGDIIEVGCILSATSKLFLMPNVRSVSTIGLVNGGTAGLIWITFVCWIGFIFINISMAEMGSMAPTTGGQYHWVSEFASRKHQKLISYLMGWLCVLGWQTGCASLAYLAGTQIQGLAVVRTC